MTREQLFEAIKGRKAILVKTKFTEGLRFFKTEKGWQDDEEMAMPCGTVELVDTLIEMQEGVMSIFDDEIVEVVEL